MEKISTLHYSFSKSDRTSETDCLKLVKQTELLELPDEAVVKNILAFSKALEVKRLASSERVDVILN